MFNITNEDSLALMFYFLFWLAVLWIVGWYLSFVFHLPTYNVLAIGLLSVWMSYMTVVIYKFGTRS
jgi:hypothetical protein